MKSKFLNFYKFSFLITIFLLISLSYLSYRNPIYNHLILLAIVSIIFIFQYLVILSDFNNNSIRILWVLSYLMGLSIAINFNKEWFLLSWKYQLIIIVFMLYFTFILNFISKVKKWILLLLFLNNFLFCGYLLYIVMYNFEDIIYFEIAKWLSIYMILSSVVLSLNSRLSKLKVESEKK